MATIDSSLFELVSIIEPKNWMISMCVFAGFEFALVDTMHGTTNLLLPQWACTLITRYSKRYVMGTFSLHDVLRCGVRNPLHVLAILACADLAGEDNVEQWKAISAYVEVVAEKWRKRQL